MHVWMSMSSILRRLCYQCVKFHKMVFSTWKISLTWDGSHSDLVALNGSISLLPFHLQSVLRQDRQLQTTLKFKDIMEEKKKVWFWNIWASACGLVQDLGQEKGESMTVAGFSEIKEANPLTSSSLYKNHLLFQLHLHNFQQGFSNKQCLSYFYPLALHPSLSPAACSSIKACPVLSSGIETGTGCWLGTGRSWVMSEERHSLTLCQGFVCTMWWGNRWRGRWAGEGENGSEEDKGV